MPPDAAVAYAMKLALILPRARLWRWHLALVQALAEGREVSVLLAPGRPYPRALRLWLALERAAFGTRGGAAPIEASEIAAADWTPAALEDCGAVVDLAGMALGDFAGLRFDLAFDGATDEGALFGALLRRRAPHLAVRRDGEVAAASFPALEVKEELGRGLALIQARTIALVLRALADRSRGEETPAAERRPSPYGVVALARFVVFCLRVKIAAKLSGGRSATDHWSIAVRRRTGAGEPSPEGFSPVAAGADAFYADPFLLEHGGRTWLFAEAYPYAEKKGVVVCAALDAAGRAGPYERVLEQSYHLSYPQVFVHDGDVWMLPETAANRRLELYRATDFPRGWTLAATMLEGLRIADATLLAHEGRWWLFASVAEHGGSSQDELFAWHGPSPFGPWTAHLANPLKSDVRSSRPAGRFVRRGGRLFRPAQDCEASYGAGLVWCEVLELTPQAYRERIVARWAGAGFGDYTGVHTFTEGGGFEAVDLKRPRTRRPGQTP